MFDFLKSKYDIILWDEVSAPQRLSLWKATSMRSLSILPQLPGFQPFSAQMDNYG